MLEIKKDVSTKSVNVYVKLFYVPYFMEELGTQRKIIFPFVYKEANIAHCMFYL